ncbi:pilus assembly protein [Thiocystis violacea]|uniref:pilus assembly protein n=1 Tax=Thiocystis violacea TaxID=13725 RepID=UPI0019030948|nr:pilus assembly protein [Thiocystis violacea]MBK1717703.1 hypothetical protein [Thiocystis violacea]
MNERAFTTKTTRRATAFGLLLSASLLGATSVQARPDTHWGPGHQMDLETRVERMTQDFNLTEAQQEQVRAILENSRKEQARLRQASREQIDAILTEEQKTRREALMQERQDHRLERLTAKLDLTTDQTARIKEVFDEQRKNPELTPTLVRERISGILSAEQREAFERGPMRRPDSDRRDSRDGSDGERRDG